MTDYRGFRIRDIHAIVSIGPDDEEGIVAAGVAGAPLPLIASDKVRLDQLKQMAQIIADATGQTFKVIRFSVREEVCEIKSRRLS